MATTNRVYSRRPAGCDDLLQQGAHNLWQQGLGSPDWTCCSVRDFRATYYIEGHGARGRADLLHERHRESGARGLTDPL
jgi:hypothetical protein